MQKIIDIFLSNMTQKAKRLGLNRRTLYAWKSNPKQATLDLIEKDLRALLALIEEERGLQSVLVLSDSDLTYAGTRKKINEIHITDFKGDLTDAIYKAHIVVFNSVQGVKILKSR